MTLIFRFPQFTDDQAKAACDGGERSDSNRHESEGNDAAGRNDWHSVAVSDGRYGDDRPTQNSFRGVESDFSAMANGR